MSKLILNDIGQLLAMMIIVNNQCGDFLIYVGPAGITSVVVGCCLHEPTKLQGLQDHKLAPHVRDVQAAVMSLTVELTLSAFLAVVSLVPRLRPAFRGESLGTRLCCCSFNKKS